MEFKTISSTEAQNNFGRVIDDAIQNHTSYFVKRRNTSQVILISLSDFQDLLFNQENLEEIKGIVSQLKPLYDLGEIVEK